jgi:hypothetical protein
VYVYNFILSPYSNQPAEDCVGVDYRIMDYQTEYSLNCQIVKVMVIGDKNSNYRILDRNSNYRILDKNSNYRILEKTPTTGYWMKTPAIGYWIKTPTIGYWIKTPTIGYWTLKKTYI